MIVFNLYDYLLISFSCKIMTQNITTLNTRLWLLYRTPNIYLKHIQSPNINPVDELENQKKRYSKQKGPKTILRRRMVLN